MKIALVLYVLLWLGSAPFLTAEDASTPDKDEMHPSRHLRRDGDDNGKRDLTFQICATIPTDRYYHIIAQNSGMSVNVDQKSTSNGACLIQWPVSAGMNDNWRFQSTGWGYYQMIAEHSQKAANGTFTFKKSIIVVFCLRSSFLIIFCFLLYFLLCSTWCWKKQW